MPDPDSFSIRSNSDPSQSPLSGTGIPARFIPSSLREDATIGGAVDPAKIRWLKDFPSTFIIRGQPVHDIIDGQIQRYCDERPMDFHEAHASLAKKVASFGATGGETFTKHPDGERITGPFSSAGDRGRGRQRKENRISPTAGVVFSGRAGKCTLRRDPRTSLSFHPRRIRCGGKEPARNSR